MQTTSIQAKESIQEYEPTLLQRVCKRIRQSPATCDEVERDLNLKHQTTSARIRQLVQLRIIEDSGIRRMTRSGRNAIVWRLLQR